MIRRPVHCRPLSSSLQEVASLLRLTSWFGLVASGKVSQGLVGAVSRVLVSPGCSHLTLKAMKALYKLRTCRAKTEQKGSKDEFRGSSGVEMGLVIQLRRRE